MTGKQFLLGLAAVAVIVWMAGNWIFGPPGLSSDYLDEYGQEHEHYLEIIKSNDYRLYQQRPELHAPGMPESPAHLAEQLAFVDAYTSRPAFRAEEQRIGWYATFFDFFNASLVIIIAARFGWRPLMNFLDARIGDLKERMADAEQTAATAAKRKAEAMALMEGLPDAESRVSEEMRTRQLIELAELEKANRYSIELMKKELEERRQAVYINAQQRVKREMVDATIRRLTAWHEEGTSPEYRDYLLNQFIADLEQRT